ncbi:hypothetical protein MYAM1_003512 [Malassezia yamatoensis]|uniref:Golgi pH regulator n=1 Tax=Malassezia yamatoensis TaxID=253288 RepID=A0AAJ5YUS7_9BASI|nr:hypothetical protein MYAM1_003512 [Malassezia yamatoensis]
MSGGAWVLVLVVRAALGFCAVLVLPWLLGEVSYVSLEPQASWDVGTLPRVAHMRVRSGSIAHTYVQAVRKQLRLSSVLFCVALEESATLLVLVLLQHSYGNAVWIHRNWSFSLAVVLTLIVLGLPLTACYLLCFSGGKKQNWSTSRAVGTTVLFLAWCWAFLRVPLPHSVVVATSGTTGFILARAGMLGVIMIATLSGSAAAGAICDSYENIVIRSRKRWRENDRQSAQDSFQRACLDLQTAQTTAAQIQEAIQQEAPRNSWIPWSKSTKQRELQAIRTEIIGLEAMATTMQSDLEMIQEQDRRTRYQRTPLGRILLLAGHAFSAYCAFRLLQCVLNLVFLGYSAPSSDFVSAALAHAVRLLGVEIDVALWAPRIGFLLVGGLIVLRMRVLLSTLATLIRSVSAGISAQFLVLFTAEVVCIYTLAALIQLHASVGTRNNSTNTLLATLPEFQRVFGALFDVVFLIVALLTNAYRWFQWQSDAFSAFAC